MNKKFKKTVIINRAVPGSGKTTLSRCINSTLANAGLSIISHSTDDFFMQGNRYCFDIRKLHQYHQQNLHNFRRSLARGVDVVICDNTNLVPWQAEPYTHAARDYGYQVIFLNLPPRELYKHIQAQKVTPEKPDAHQVPEECLIRFIRDFNNYNPLLSQENTVDPQHHHHFVWNQKKYCPERVGQAEHFDLDYLVTVYPDEYHTAKDYIGDNFLQLILH